MLYRKRSKKVVILIAPIAVVAFMFGWELYWFGSWYDSLMQNKKALLERKQ